MLKALVTSPQSLKSVWEADTLSVSKLVIAYPAWPGVGKDQPETDRNRVSWAVKWKDYRVSKTIGYDEYRHSQINQLQ